MWTRPSVPWNVITFVSAEEEASEQGRCQNLPGMHVSGLDRLLVEAPGGVEPPTNGLGNRCSIHLSYGAKAERT